MHNRTTVKHIYMCNAAMFLLHTPNQSSISSVYHREFGHTYSNNRPMGSKKPTPKAAASSVTVPTKSRGAITKSAAPSRKRKTRSKASEIIEPIGSDQTRPKAPSEEIVSSPSPNVPRSYLQADEDNESSESYEDLESCYVYKVVQHLDFPGYEVEDGEKMKVLGTFDDKEKAIQAASKQHRFFAELAEPSCSLTRETEHGLLIWSMIQGKSGKRKEVKIEVEREVRKSQAPREVFAVVREGRENIFESGDEGDVQESYTAAIYQDLKSAIERLRREPVYVFEDWMPYPKGSPDVPDSDFFHRHDWEENGKPAIRMWNPSEKLAVTVSISVEYMFFDA